ncbi:MAG TPA: hypothetical protein VHM25_20300, partial [Polyangiaceae bacterium]|nr:hypothetical protein [Polyangiaceae bacterium]
MSARSWFLLLWLSVVLGGACTRRAPPHSTNPAPSASPATRNELLASNGVAAPIHGDAARGRELVEHFECNRCHEGTGLGSAPLAKNCFSCHEQIITGQFPVSAAALARFRPHVASAREAPTLTALARLEAGWVIEYLLAPGDLRPKLTPTMPRLPLDRGQATDIAAYFGAIPAPVADSLPVGSARRGRELMEQKGCASCHAFTGVPAFSVSEPPPVGSDAARAAALAPDLRFTRERFRRERLLGFL